MMQFTEEQRAELARQIKGQIEDLTAIWVSSETAEDDRKEALFRMEVAAIALAALESPPVAAPAVPEQGSDAVNDAAWLLHDLLAEDGPLTGHQFNNLKGSFYEAMKVALGITAPDKPL